MFRSAPAHRRFITDEDISFCYRCFLEREPDPAGMAHYAAQKKHTTLDQLIRNFIGSDEFVRKIQNRKLPPDIEEVGLGGYRVAVHRTDADFGDHLFSFKEYEEHVRAAVREVVRPGDTFVDIGANVGVMTFLASGIVGPQGRVIAIEPDADNLQMLYRGILLNQSTNVEVWPFAASNERRLVPLSGMSNAHIEDADAGVPVSRYAEAVRLDDLLGELPRLDCVKMDIEGHEPAATEGFWKNLMLRRPSIVIEWNPRTLIRAKRDARQFGATLLQVQPSLTVLSAFGDRHTVTTADELMSLWTRRDAELSASGQLPPGALHFDLVGVRPNVHP